MSQFGNLFVASELEEAVIDQLKTWFPSYLREIEDKLGMAVGVLVQPRVYTTRNTFEAIAGENMPLCVVISPGLLNEPVTFEAGKYTASWSVGVGIAIAANDEPTANKLAKIYGAGVRGILLQNQALGGLAVRVDWLDENYEELPIEDQLLHYKSVGVYFSITVENVVDKYAGVALPDDDPYPPFNTVDEVIVDVGHL